MRPLGFHAACGGEVLVERQDAVQVPTWTCQKCQNRLVDPLELAPRGTGFVPPPDARLRRSVERYRLDV